ncbi:hypothetical protein HCN44_001791 [Aphidius gifuensis]|uniref:Cationic amino acid transporter C-terminal domain-containing protein n=1 Tax=Aphidius gifuensis TaxID=684658 RepID=A0A834XLX7_APHGI|nr:cationic amino acid transporter 2-like [Aphidius gifuensis]XP_044019578.1 cationic amino acid transporter 2-like [Aphidius gifuensis]KAF7987136.1 hypothetical protein HCN44_001791 [Aphidius gifuensis]
MVKLGNILQVFTRKKMIDSTNESSLTRCLSTLDLTFLGIGSTLGVGIYVLAGSIAHHDSGPAIIISFAIAAIASIFAGLCYAEFGARVPRAGSAYAYCYVTMGEFIAFLIGWILILEYVIGAASVVKGLSTNFDAFINYKMKAFFESLQKLDPEYTGGYPDLFAFTVTIIFSLAIAFGAKESSLLNNFLTIVNLGVVLFVIIVGSIYVKISNWQIDTGCTEVIKHNVTCEYGRGGFAPYGVVGIIAGATKCFYCFIGFDCIATASEEARNPKKSIPISIVASLTIVFLAYCAVSSVMTLVVDYRVLNDDSPLPAMFESVQLYWAKNIIFAGSMCAIGASLLGSLFPLPRVIYAMASDGLIFKFMGKLHPKFQTPVIGTLIAGLITGILSGILNLNQLSSLMSLGVLSAYSTVASCVLILRYKECETFEKRDDREPRTVIYIVKQLLNLNNTTRSTKLTSQIASSLVFLYILSCIPTTLFIINSSQHILNGSFSTIGVLVAFISILVLILICIYRQPVSDKKLLFSVPLVPFLPAFSIFINVSLMMTLEAKVWYLFTAWLSIGLVIYFLYGIKNSRCGSQLTNLISEKNQNNKRNVQQEINNGMAYNNPSFVE